MRDTECEKARRKVVSAALAGAFACCSSLGAAQTAPAPPSAAALSGAEAVQSAFTQVAESVSKSVVAMRVESRRKLVNPFEGLPFGDWFGPQNPGDQWQVQRGTGS